MKERVLLALFIVSEILWVYFALAHTRCPYPIVLSFGSVIGCVYITIWNVLNLCEHAMRTFRQK